MLVALQGGVDGSDESKRRKSGWWYRVWIGTEVLAGVWIGVGIWRGGFVM